MTNTRNSQLATRYPLLITLPLLAFLAYLPAAGIGFLSDDFGLLSEARRTGLDLRTLLPADWIFYRPVSFILTWQLGWLVWGYNPLPYHLLGLAIHAAASLSLGLWISEVSRRRSLGLLGGAIFATFPLHTEAVGWLAAQWDAWATLFGISSLWLFTRWWRGGNRTFYFLSLLLYALGIFSKESLLAFLSMFVASAWLTAPFSRQELRRLALAILPFCAVLGLNLAARFLSWGNLGGYLSSRASTDYAGFFWDALVSHTLTLLAPLNPALLGDAPSQVVGALSSLALLLGLVVLRRERRLFAAGGIWLLLALLPVLNLPVNPADLQQNRVLYLASAGYSLLLALPLSAALNYSLRRGAWLRRVVPLLIGLLILASAITCWLHLQSWLAASRYAEEIRRDLLALVPPQPASTSMIWSVENLPATYKGAYIYPSWLGAMRTLTSGDSPEVRPVEDAVRPMWDLEEGDLLSVRFIRDAQGSPSVGYAARLTPGSPLSSQQEGGDSVLWDFTTCLPTTVRQWQARNAEVRCEPGVGLALAGGHADTQMIAEGLKIRPAPDVSRFLRLDTAIAYPPDLQGGPYLGEWFWQTSGSGWSVKMRAAVPLKRDGILHVYSTFVPLSDAGTITALRFDPANGPIVPTIRWIALSWSSSATDGRRQTISLSCCRLPDYMSFLTGCWQRRSSRWRCRGSSGQIVMSWL